MKPFFQRLAVAALATTTAGQLDSATPIVEKPLAPAEAARTMRVPKGFNVTLFAGEPDVMQPIGFCIDDRGRLWVAEAYNYPKHGTEPGDRIVVFEDVDHDGRFDKRTVFFDKLNYVTGIEVGFGGAWVMSPPYFYFIPDRDGDLVPDGKPTVLLDGFGNHANSHNLANGFSWGPDGWLYATHGRTNWSTPDKPGTPKERRKRYDGGVWRYHPIRHIWEPFADGTTNPWGIDWDDYGQGFVCNCVNPHLFHVIQGAHYEPWRNYESSRYSYTRISTIADHLHFLGVNNVRLGIGTEAELAIGGGHAHSGTMIYLGDNWPDEYRNSVFMNNIHGHRVNHDVLQRKGSGYFAKHAPDVMIAEDQWFMGVTLRYGPDGGVFVSDWSDTGECHSVRNTRKTTGRLFKIAYGQPKPFTQNLAGMKNSELVDLQLHKNDWFVQHARRLLQERFAAGVELSKARNLLRKLFSENPDVTRKLRALWALHVIDGLDDEFLRGQLDHESEYVRAWAVRLLSENRQPSPATLRKFQLLAAKDSSQFVRLHLASALQQFEPAKRWDVATALSRRADDANDHNLPAMYWYAIEPLVREDLTRFVSLALQSRIPLVRSHIARRAASLPGSDGVNAVVTALPRLQSEQAQTDFLTGALTGLEGRRELTAPSGWSAIYAKLNASQNASVREQATQLALIFNDPAAIRSLLDTAGDHSVTGEIRGRAIEALVSRRANGLSTLLLKLVSDPAVQRHAICGLAGFNDTDTPSTLLRHYASLDTLARQDALQTLSARAAWAEELMGAIERKRVPRTDMSAYTARQIQSLGVKKLTEQVEKQWGKLGKSSGDKQKQIANYRRTLDERSLSRANPANGRATFQLLCAVCHTLFDDGKDIGPNLTGSQRSNMDYLLENILDPSASVARDYQMQVIETKSDRTINGFLIAETETTVTIQTVNERLVIPRLDIHKQAQSTSSIMPDGLLQALSTDQARNLFAYLRSQRQVPLPEAK